MTQTTRKPLTTLPTDKLAVAPSILAADFAALGRDIRAAEQGGADMVHIDVMDGHLVPNISMGPPVVAGIRGATELPFDVHLMLRHPQRYIEPFVLAGADHITIHVEMDGNVRETLHTIRGLGCSAGISMRPGTPAEALREYLDDLDMILVMTVEPGFGGQSFRGDMLPKIRAFWDMIENAGHPVHLQIDGGINAETAAEVIDAGANVLVAGSSVFRAPDGIASAIDSLHKAWDRVHGVST